MQSSPSYMSVEAWLTIKHDRLYCIFTLKKVVLRFYLWKITWKKEPTNVEHYHPKKRLIVIWSSDVTFRNASAKKALDKFAEPARDSTGRPSATWFMNTIKDIRENTTSNWEKIVQRNLEILEHMFSDRETWNRDADSIKLTRLTKMQLSLLLLLLQSASLIFFRSRICNSTMLSITITLSFNIIIKKVPVQDGIFRNIISLKLSIII